MTFRESHIDISGSSTIGGAYLGEPVVISAIEGKIYVSGHTAAAGGHSPTFFSATNGSTWSLLSVQSELGGVEGDLAADGRGNAWLLDMSGAALPLYRWTSNGTTGAATSNVWDRFAQSPSCTGQIADRPQIKYGNNKLVLVNNDGGIMDVGLLDLADHDTTVWKNCVETEAYPGVVPAIRDTDGKIAVVDRHKINAQQGLSSISIKFGNSPTSLSDSGSLLTFTLGTVCPILNAGMADFSKSGNLWTETLTGSRQVTIVNSSNLATWTMTNFTLVGDGYKIFHHWISASKRGDGALLTWSAVPSSSADCSATHTYYAAHLAPGPGGSVNMTDISAVAVDVRASCLDFGTSVLDPKGNAIVAVWGTFGSGAPAGYCPTSVTAYHPLYVYIQDAGTRI